MLFCIHKCPERLKPKAGLKITLVDELGLLGRGGGVGDIITTDISLIILGQI